MHDTAGSAMRPTDLRLHSQQTHFRKNGCASQVNYAHNLAGYVKRVHISKLWPPASVKHFAETSRQTELLLKFNIQR